MLQNCKINCVRHNKILWCLAKSVQIIQVELAIIANNFLMQVRIIVIILLTLAGNLSNLGTVHFGPDLHHQEYSNYTENNAYKRA